MGVSTPSQHRLNTCFHVSTVGVSTPVLVSQHLFWCLNSCHLRQIGVSTLNRTPCGPALSDPPTLALRRLLRSFESFPNIPNISNSGLSDSFRLECLNVEDIRARMPELSKHSHHSSHSSVSLARARRRGSSPFRRTRRRAAPSS